VQHEAFGHDLDDLAGPGARHRRLEHGLMQLRIECGRRPGARRASCRASKTDSKLAQGQLHPSITRLGGGALFLPGRIQRAAEVVVDRQKVAREREPPYCSASRRSRSARLRLFSAFGERAQHPVLQLVPFRPQKVKLDGRIGRDVFIGRSSSAGLPRRLGHVMSSMISSFFGSAILPSYDRSEIMRPTNCAV
jgi:hypothetical protein